jgi:hypothetical protein
LEFEERGVFPCHAAGLCGGNQPHARGTWDNGISLLAGVYFSSNLTVGRDIQKVSERVTIIETKLSQQALSERLKKLEDEVAKLRPAPPTTP